MRRISFARSENVDRTFVVFLSYSRLSTPLNTKVPYISRAPHTRRIREHMPPASYSYIFETQPGTTRTFLVFTWRTFLYFSYCYRFCDTHIYIYRYNTVITDKYNTTIELHNISWQGHGGQAQPSGRGEGTRRPLGGRLGTRSGGGAQHRAHIRSTSTSSSSPTAEPAPSRP